MEEKKIYIPLKVSASVILYIGAGIYHSIAGALKELINNSYDAGAKTVSVDTHYPIYDEIHVVDDGVGMSLDEFELAMRTIGSSLKGESMGKRISPIFSRPVIGHLGIGLLALTQICEKAIIESTKEGLETKFIAILDFTEFHKGPSEQIEKARRDILLEKKELSNLVDRLNLIDSGDDRKSSLEDEQLGYCIVYPDQPSDKTEQGTKIILQGIKPEIISKMKDEGRSLDGIRKFTKRQIDWHNYLEELRRQYSWKDICEGLRLNEGGRTFQTLPYYYHFLWELGLQTPVPYFDDAPIIIDKDILKAKKKELKKFSFAVVVDGNVVCKPIRLPAGELAQIDVKIKQGFDYKIEPVFFNHKVENESLKFEGYIYWQRSQITPDAQRGIQIYIRNSGIGIYDKNLLGFTNVNPSSRAGQISAEIYVSAGLERALNIDRKSFRETDSHYVALQQYIWKKLGSTSQTDGIFGESVKAYHRRKDLQLEEQTDLHKKEISELVEQISDRRLQVQFKESKPTSPPYEIAQRKIYINLESTRWPKSVQEKRLAQKILVVAQAALVDKKSLKNFIEELENILLKER